MSTNPYLGRILSILGLQSFDSEFDASCEELMAVDESSGLYDDVYVVNYDFKGIGEKKFYYPLE